MSNDFTELLHDYDPVKAREYYLRTRKLKGRTKGADETPKTDGNKHPAGSPKKTHLSKAEADKAHRAHLKAEAEKRVAALSERLAKLKDILAELVKQAKENSGVETKPNPKDSKKADKTPAKEKPKTAAEKKKDAKAAQERRDKANPSLSDKAKTLDAQIKSTSDKIKKMRQQIADDRKRAQKKHATAQPKRTATKEPLTSKERR